MNTHEIAAHSSLWRMLVRLLPCRKTRPSPVSYQATSVALEEQGSEKARELMHKDGSELQAERASMLQMQRLQKNYIAFCNGFEMDPGVWAVHVSLGLSACLTLRNGELLHHATGPAHSACQLCQTITTSCHRQDQTLIVEAVKRWLAPHTGWLAQPPKTQNHLPRALSF